ncbi:MAG: MFS transporter [Planctomycetota bacterium]
MTAVPVAARVPRAAAAEHRVSTWRRNYLAVWASLFTTSLGLMAFLPVLTVYVGEAFAITDPDELTLWGSLIYGVAPLTAALLGPLWGALGDRVGKKPMAIRANVAIALSTAVMPFAPTPLALLGLRAVQGAFAGYVAPAMALVTQDAPPERQGRTIGSLQAAMALGLGLGPILGSEVTLLYGRHAILWLTSALTGLAALLLWRFAREVRPEPRRDRPTFRAEFSASLRGLLANRVFAVLLLLILGLRLGQNMLEPFVALFVQELGAPEWVAALCESDASAIERTIGLSFTVLALAQVIFTPFWGRASDRFGPLRCLALLAIVLGVVQAVTATVQTSNAFLLWRTVAACFMAGSMTLAYAAASRRVLAERRTLAFALVQSCMQLGFAGGPVLGGRLAQIGATDAHANLRLPFAAAGTLCVLAGVGMVLLRMRSQGRRGGLPPPVGTDRL